MNLIPPFVNSIGGFFFMYCCTYNCCIYKCFFCKLLHFVCLLNIYIRLI